MRRHITKKMVNAAYRRPNFVGLLLALDTYYNRGASRASFQKTGISGGKMQVNMWQSLPVTRGVNAFNPDYRQREIPLAKNARHNAITFDASSYEGAEPVDKAEIAALKGDAVVNLVRDLGDRSAESIITKLDADMFPAVQQVGGAGNPHGPDHIMALAYPLQTGYAANAATGTGSYPYGGMDLNAYPQMKATTYGSDSSAVTTSISNVRKRLIRPLQDLGANIDIILAGSADYEYLMTQAESIRRDTGNDKTLEWNGEFFKLGDAFVVLETGIDRLTNPELYTLDSSTWTFAMDETVGASVDHITKVPKMPSIELFQWFFQCGLVCTNPRFNGRLNKTQTA